VSRRDRLNELIRIINDDFSKLAEQAQEKKLRYLDFNNIKDEETLKEEIQKELEV